MPSEKRQRLSSTDNFVDRYHDSSGNSYWDVNNAISQPGQLGGPTYLPSSPSYSPCSPPYRPSSPPYRPSSPSYRPSSPFYRRRSPSHDPRPSNPVHEPNFRYRPTSPPLGLTSRLYKPPRRPTGPRNPPPKPPSPSRGPTAQPGPSHVQSMCTPMHNIVSNPQLPSVHNSGASLVITSSFPGSRVPHYEIMNKRSHTVSEPTFRPLPWSGYEYNTRGKPGNEARSPPEQRQWSGRKGKRKIREWDPEEANARKEPTIPRHSLSHAHTPKKSRNGRTPKREPHSSHTKVLQQMAFSDPMHLYDLAQKKPQLQLTILKRRRQEFSNFLASLQDYSDAEHYNKVSLIVKVLAQVLSYQENKTIADEIDRVVLSELASDSSRALLHALGDTFCQMPMQNVQTKRVPFIGFLVDVNHLFKHLLEKRHAGLLLTVSSC